MGDKQQYERPRLISLRDVIRWQISAGDSPFAVCSGGGGPTGGSNCAQGMDAGPGDLCLTGAAADVYCDTGGAVI